MLYIADAELATTLKKATKTKDDHAHAGQLEYTHWINCIIDSTAIMRWYGIAPSIRSRDVVEQMLPDLLVFIDHFNAKDKKQTKTSCATLATNMFGPKGFVSAVNRRELGAIKCYNRPRSLLVFLKLLHAYAIKNFKKTQPFLSGGLYHGCKNPGGYYRDSLYVKDKDDKQILIKVDDFKFFALATNQAFVSPRTMAAYLFNFKGPRNLQNHHSISYPKRQIHTWKAHNEEGPYIRVTDTSSDNDGV